MLVAPCMRSLELLIYWNSLYIFSQRYCCCCCCSYTRSFHTFTELTSLVVRRASHSHTRAHIQNGYTAVVFNCISVRVFIHAWIGMCSHAECVCYGISRTGYGCKCFIRHSSSYFFFLFSSPHCWCTNTQANSRCVCTHWLWQPYLFFNGICNTNFVWTVLLMAS